MRHLGSWAQRAGFLLAINSGFVFIYFLTFLVGYRALLLPDHLSPDSLVLLLPGWVLNIWGGFLVFGGVVGLTGVVAPSPAIERAGAVSLAGAAVVQVFSIVAFWTVARDSNVPVLLVWLALLVSMLARYWALGLIERLEP